MVLHDEYNALLAKIYALQNKGIKLDLKNVTQILKKLGNPHNCFRSLHIAGTNGKGSVAAMADSVLRQAGYRTGIFTSPHLEVFNERIRVNGASIPDETALSAAKRVLAADGENLTFFEIVTVMAFLIFAESQLDFVVLETGMGGRLDATNVVLPEVTLITNVTLEHTQWLGDTVAKIAFEKAGIIKRNIPVITAAEGDALDVIKRRALDREAPLSILGHDFEAINITKGGCFYPAFDYYAREVDLTPEDEAGKNLLRFKDLQPGLAGCHQIKNAACVIRMLEYLQATGVEIPAAAVRDGLALTRWPGRFEIICRNPMVILDGAHNLAGAEALANCLLSHRLTGKITMISGILADKEYPAMLDVLLPLCRRAIFTKPQNERALNPHDLLSLAQKFPVESYVEEDIKTAIDFGFKLLEGDDVLCISGSLYLVGVGREILMDMDLNHF